MQLRFAQSLRGLTVGAPVLFAGVTLGSVVSMNLDYDQSRRRFPTAVGIVVYPQRLGPVPDAPQVPFDVNARPLTVPTIDGSFDRVPEQVANIVGKIDRLPLASIAGHLDAALAGLGDTLGQVNGQVLPETTRTLQQAQQTFGTAQGMLASDAPLQQDLGRTLQEVQRAAYSLRTLTDVLGRHPQSLLRGLPADTPSAPALQPTTTTAPESPR